MCIRDSTPARGPSLLRIVGQHRIVGEQAPHRGDPDDRVGAQRNVGARHTGEGGRQVSEGAGFALVDRSGEPVARDVRREHAVDDQVLVGDPDLREFRCGAGGFGERGRLCAGCLLYTSRCV